jgi:hypothetical protein
MRVWASSSSATGATAGGEAFFAGEGRTVGAKGFAAAFTRAAGAIDKKTLSCACARLQASACTPVS